jgi:phosphoenolpyruvate---glycerone phosphotransferase subunit DhaL
MGRIRECAFLCKTMSGLISKADLSKMFASAAQQIRDSHEMLSQLDSVGGDGDHGTTMVRAMEELNATFDQESTKKTNAILTAAGWKVMGVDGGASSAIFGTFISGMGDAEVGDDLDCEGVAGSFQAGLRAVCNRTKARIGDKTMMDALIPAVETFQAAASSGKTIALAMKEAALAAVAGAASTKDLIARYGRARYLGERTLGHIDPGAASIALLFRGFSEALAPNECGTAATAKN